MRIPETPPEISPQQAGTVSRAADVLKESRESESSRIFIFGAHLIKNGVNPILIKLMEEGWITHLATNGAGVIHDWEFAFAGKSTECVRNNVAEGKFGTWSETGFTLNLCAHLGGFNHSGFGGTVGQLICEDGLILPTQEDLRTLITSNPGGKQTGAAADLLRAMTEHDIDEGWWTCKHRHRQTSVLGAAWSCNVPVSVHPGIGYDIFTNHPMFHGGAIGRAAGIDFQKFSAAVSGLDKGSTFSIGSAIMGPQVFEKSLSCVNNLRIQNEQLPITDHSIFVIDLQDGGNWDWSQGEPPTDNPAYYLRFCKSYSRMGGTMHYASMDNLSFIYHLARELGVLP